MKKIFFIILFLLPFFIFSQKKKTQSTPKTQSTVSSKVQVNKPENTGFSINITTQNIDNETVRLKFYRGSYKISNTIDSTKINEQNKTISFSKKNNIISFPVSFSLKKAKDSILFILSNGVKINGTLKTPNLKELEIKDPLNKDFLIYQKINESEKKISFARQMLKNYPQNDGLKFFLNYDLLELEIKNATSKISIEEKLKSTLKEVDLNAKNATLMPNVYGFLNTYFKNSSDYNDAIDDILKTIPCDSPNFDFFVNWIVKNLKLKGNSNEDVKENYSYLLDNYLKIPACEKKMGKSMADIESNMITDKSLPIGKPLPNLPLKQTNGSELMLQDFLEKYKNITVVAFYDPTCEHCIKDVPIKAQKVADFEQKYKVTINKIGVMYIGDEAKWKDFIQKSHLENWLNVTSSTSKPIAEDLTIAGTPSYVILDENGVVISRYISEQILYKALGKLK